MSGDGTYREPAAPKLIRRVNPSREFGSDYTEAQTVAATETAKAGFLIVIGSAVFGATSYFTVPRVVSHFGSDTHAGARFCDCGAFPFTLLFFAGFALSVWAVLSGIANAKPARAEFRNHERSLAEIRRFNSEAADLNFEIRSFDESPAWRRHEIVAQALYLAERRPRILRLAKVRHER